MILTEQSLSQGKNFTVLKYLPEHIIIEKVVRDLIVASAEAVFEDPVFGTPGGDWTGNHKYTAAEGLHYYDDATFERGERRGSYLELLAERFECSTRDVALRLLHHMAFSIEWNDPEAREIWDELATYNSFQNPVEAQEGIEFRHGTFFVDEEKYEIGTDKWYELDLIVAERNGCDVERVRAQHARLRREFSEDASASLKKIQPPAVGVEVVQVGDIETPGAIYWKRIHEDFIKRSDAFNLTGYDFTEDDAGRLVADLFGEWLRYNSTSRGFMAWTGDRWVLDRWHLAEKAAELTARLVQSRLAEMQPRNLGEAAAFVRKLRSATGIRAALFYASSDPRLTTTADDYDQNPDLLNTPTGTYNLVTGDVHAHRRTDLITKITAYSPDITPSVYFEKFLDQITLGRDDLKNALWRMCGSGASGRAPKEALIFWIGGGANGKSVLIESIADTLGDYARPIRVDSILEAKRSSGHTDEIASLNRVRLAYSAEMGQASRLDESRAKSLSGGDSQLVSFKGQSSFVMRPCYTLIISSNHKPRIIGTDDGIWRRIRFVPFSYKVPVKERDLNFKAKMLQADAGYILHWIITGCRKWMQSGYGESETIAYATNAYRMGEDTLGRFIEEICYSDTHEDESAGDLRTAFEKWARDNGEHVLSGRAWREALEERGFIRRKSRTGYRWTGIILKERADNAGNLPL